MGEDRSCRVHLLPSQIANGEMAGGLAVVIDVLRASTVIVHALAAGCASIIPCCEIEEAKALRVQGKKVLGGERLGKPIRGFDLGNSPKQYTAKICKNATIALTTTNGTRALTRAIEADRVLVAAFVNFSAVCEQLATTTLPVHIVCAGTDGSVSFEDTLLAGAFVDYLCEVSGGIRLNDSARLAWDCFENNGRMLIESISLGAGGERLRTLKFESDIHDAADVDRYAIVPELRRDPLRIERGSVGIVKSHWPR